MSDTRTWGTVIGAVAGYFTGGISYVGLGAAAGGIVGGLLEPTKKVEQGRIDDLKVSVSQYGAGIPETWGNNVPPATWVWATDVIEIGQTQSAGGKGGGGTEVTQYRQFIHGFIVLGRTPPVGSTISIRKALVDGKLTYDASSGLSVAQALASEENPFAQISLHPGWEDQIPHPIMEFYEGIGNTPAYRGVVGVFVFGLECPGGRIPQLSFELCINANTDVVRQDYADVPAESVNHTAIWAVIRNESIYHYASLGLDYDGTFRLKVSFLSAGSSTLKNVIRVTGAHYGLNPIPVSGDGPPGALRLRRAASATLNDYHYLDFFDFEQGTYSSKLQYIPGDSGVFIDPKSAGFDSASGKFAVISTTGIYATRVAIVGAGGIVGSDTIPGTNGAVTIKDNVVYTLSHISRVLRITKFDGDSGALLDTFLGPTVSDSTGMAWAGLHPGDDALYVWMRDVSLYNLWAVDYSSGQWSLIDDNVNTISGTEKIGNQATTFFANRRYALIGPSYEQGMVHNYTMCRFGLVQPTEAPIDEVIEAQCDRVGLVGQIDVSTIDDTIWGYTFNKSPASARNNIAPLLTYAGAIQVEEDGLIRFKHRADQAPVATITYDELGCVEDGQEPEDPFPLTRTQEAECPRSVTVQYLNPLFDYQTSTETAQRIVTDSELDETVTLDVAMLPDRAATIAHRILYERWVSRITRSFKVSRKHADKSPGDVVTVEYPRGTFGNYMLAKVNDTGALIEGECTPADAELLTQTVPGTNGYTGQQITPLAPQTRLLLIDSAILRDADNNAGLYAAMEGYSSGWLGAELYAGDDAGSLQPRGSITSEAVIGVCETTLANYSRGNVDEHNLLTVNIGSGSLSSITRDVLLNGAQNVAVVGRHGRWEVIKFQRADDLGSGRYILSGLLRGLKGTEWAAGLHQADDMFALMSDGGVLRPSLDLAWRGQSKTYKAVSISRRFDSAPTQTLTNTVEGLKPLSPTTLRKSFSSADIVLTWGRRTRLADQWWLGIVPLGEESQAYEIDIFSDNTFTTLKRTLSSTTATVTYTSAQQVADFGSNQTTVHVRVYQISGSVGRGHELQRSI